MSRTPDPSFAGRAGSGIPAPPSGFLDAASGQPMHPAARAALDAALDTGWADPARLYGAARRARMLLDGARESVAAALECRTDEVSFTASATQAIHLGVAGTLLGRARTGRDLVTSAVEHSAVLHAAESHERGGGTRTAVRVDRHGRVDAEEFVSAINETTALACLQSANHEVGTVQPTEAVGAACANLGVPLLVDAAQSIAHGPVMGWSLLAASAHKWGGPAGVGVLAIRKGVRWRSPSPNDEREGGRVPGFPAVPLVVAAAASLQAVRADAAAEDARLSRLVDRIRTRVPDLVPDVEVVGHSSERLPNIVTFSCLYVDGEALLSELDREGFAVSSGSSCTSSTLEPSHVLVAMGVLSHGNVRVSLPNGVAEDDVDRFLEVLPDVVDRVRSRIGARGL